MSDIYIYQKLFENENIKKLEEENEAFLSDENIKVVSIQGISNPNEDNKYLALVLYKLKKIKTDDMTQQEKRLKETIDNILETVESELKELWKNHRIGSIKENGYINLATIQKTRKTINDKLKEIEEHWK